MPTHRRGNRRTAAAASATSIKHLRVLSEAGIVEAEVDANRRIYRLRPDPFRELDKWLESYRVIWEQRFDRLDDYLQKLQGKDTKE